MANLSVTLGRSSFKYSPYFLPTTTASFMPLGAKPSTKKYLLTSFVNFSKWLIDSKFS
jgi:hypothetical protein